VFDDIEELKRVVEVSEVAVYLVVTEEAAWVMVIPFPWHEPGVGESHGILRPRSFNPRKAEIDLDSVRFWFSTPAW
jgi:hypothetical protein